MMKQIMEKWNQISQRGRAVLSIALLSFVLAVPLHEAYDLLGRPGWLGAFVPVNESVWEHLKLSFYPLLFFILVPVTKWQRKDSVQTCNITQACVAVFLSMSTVFFFYYGIHGGLGIGAGGLGIFLDISSLFLGNLLGCLHGLRITDTKACGVWNILSGVILFFMAIMFAWATYAPLPLPVFLEP